MLVEKECEYRSASRERVEKECEQRRSSTREGVRVEKEREEKECV